MDDLHYSIPEIVKLKKDVGGTLCAISNCRPVQEECPLKHLADPVCFTARARGK
jgi:hypothetical protein